MDQKPKSILEYALEYEKLGWSLMPVGSDKKPLNISWKKYQETRATPDLIRKWFERWPDTNIAVVTGKISNLVVLDLDAKHNRSAKELATKGLYIPPTVSARTGGGGEHFFFRPVSTAIGSSNGQILGNGLDVKAEGGYVVLSPSIHQSGKAYEWACSPWDIEIADIPAWLMDAHAAKGKTDWTEKMKGGAKEGTRNQTATEVIGKLLYDLSPELWQSAGWDSAVAWNKRNSKPLAEKELQTVFESIKARETTRRKEPKTESLLEEICERKDVTLFHDEQKEAYIALDISGHQEIWPCKSRAMKSLLASKAWEKQAGKKNKAPLASESIKNMITTLEGKARFEGPEIKLHNRAAWKDSELWYDLTNEECQAIKVNAEGWQIVDRPPILFKRYTHNRAQVLPTRNGDAKLFLKYVNVTKPDQQLLLLVFLASCFIPDFAHVLLVIFGPQGSSKSTQSKLTRRLVDPSIIEVAGFPENQRELVQVLAHHYFLFFDNVSYISENSSDILCKAITGSGFSKRELYENDEDVIYNMMKCIGINGINLVTTRPDLLERSLLLELERIDSVERRQEKEIYEAFEKDLPFILGGIFDVLVLALKLKPTVTVSSLPRMADFAIWGCALAEAFGYTKEDFLNAYQSNINRQSEMLLNDNIVATAIISFMADKEEWQDTPTELMRQLSSHATLAGIDTWEKYWPKGANILSRRLNELSTYLKNVGISIVTNTTGVARYIHIQKLQTESAKSEAVKSDNIDGTDDTSATLLEQGTLV